VRNKFLYRVVQKKCCWRQEILLLSIVISVSHPVVSKKYVSFFVPDTSAFLFTFFVYVKLCWFVFLPGKLRKHISFQFSIFVVNFWNCIKTISKTPIDFGNQQEFVEEYIQYLFQIIDPFRSRPVQQVIGYRKT